MGISINDYNPNEALADTDLAEVYQPSSGGVRREKKVLYSTLKTFFQGLLPGRVDDLEELQDGSAAFDAISLSSGRTAFQELTSGTLSTSGWYTIAESDTVASSVATCEFVTQLRGPSRIDSISGKVQIGNGSTAKTHQNTLVSINGRSQQSTGQGLPNYRVVKSDSVSNAGFKLQVYLDLSSSSKINTLLQGSAYDINLPTTGFQLVTPYLDNTPTLPDGVTAGTFLVAGEEYSLSRAISNFVPSVMAIKNTDDILDIHVLWPETPKQGTSLVITLPATQLRFYQNTINVAVGSYTISNFEIVGKSVYFRLTQTNIASTFALNTPTFMAVLGTGCKLTIT